MNLRMKLPTVLIGAGNGGLPVYRGIRHGSRESSYQFWTIDASYAGRYGDEILEAEILDESMILDLRGCTDPDGDYSGEMLDAACPGLADAMGIDRETVIGRDKLWDCSRDEHASAVACIRAAGWLGWRWFEGDDEAFCLILDNE